MKCWQYNGAKGKNLIKISIVIQVFEIPEMECSLISQNDQMYCGIKIEERLKWTEVVKIVQRKIFCTSLLNLRKRLPKIFSKLISDAFVALL